MTDFSEAYDSLTNQINNYVSSQTSNDWNPIPGGLSKVVSSSIGFSWGIGLQKLYYCRLPCSGKWDNVPTSEIPIDISADDTHVYVLGSSKLMIKTANNLDEWILIDIPIGANEIFCTGSFIWIQDTSGKKWKLAKPGTTGNWILVNDSTNSKITSTSTTSLYGIDISGDPMKTDESLQSGWSIIPQFGGQKYSKVIGDIDKTTLYGIDTNNQLRRCTDEKCDDVQTKGFIPENISIDPTTNTVWMTTDTSGDIGNIFNKQDSLNKSDLYKYLNPLNKQRSDIVDSIEKQQEDNQKIIGLSSSLEKIRDFLKGFIIKQKPGSTKRIESDILKDQSEIDNYTNTLPLLIKILFYLGISVIIYLFFGFLGFVGNLLVLGVLGYGVYDVYFLYKKQ
jgi:hypothetical protein